MLPALDPVTAGIEAFGQVASGVLNLFGLKAQKKIVQAQGANLDKLTTQERIKYNQLIASGNNEMASQLLASKQSVIDSSSNKIYLILGGSFLIVLIAVFVKSKKT